jgi:hypothetical protein
MQRHVIRRFLLLSTLLLYVAGQGFADGNVTVLVDGAGDLWLSGDAAGNSLRIRDETGVDGEFVLADDLGTTSVNGLPSLRVYAPGSRVIVDLAEGDDRLVFGGSAYACCDRRVFFRGGPGNDRFEMENEDVLLGDLELDLGAGDDVFLAGEDVQLGALVLVCGEGDDEVRFGPFASLLGAARIELGPGENEIVWRATAARGSVTIVGGAGPETFLVDELATDGFMSLAAGGGDDQLELGNVRPLVSPSVLLEPLVLDAGEGDDRVLLRGACELAGALVVQAGDGRDLVELRGADVRSTCAIRLGAGDDRLHVEGSSLHSAGPRLRAIGNAASGAVRFDGGAGIDLYTSGPDNSFPQGSPSLSGFEVPKATEAPALELSTRVVGRVVLPGSRPAPNAAVSLAALGRTTSADERGFFAFDLAEVPDGWLELTAAASAGGQRLCGSGRVHTSPHVADAGELVLGASCGNTLIFGDGEADAASLEQILLSAGLAADTLQRQRFLPEDLTTFGAAWHVPLSAPLDSAEQARLDAFVRSGGSVHLSGEGAAIQAAHQALVNALVVAGGIEVGIPQGDETWFPLSYAQDAVGGVARFPNALAQVSDFVTGARALGGVFHPNVFIEGASGQVFAALWDGADLAGVHGRLSLGLSTLWFRAANNLPAIENLVAFLSHAGPGTSSDPETVVPSSRALPTMRAP